MSDPTAQDGSAYLTRDQAILIATRVFIAYLLFWVVTDFTLLPREVLFVAHYMKATGSVLGTNTSLPQTSYLLRGYILDLLTNILHIALWLIAADWFYRCGPKFQRFFAPESKSEAQPATES